MSNNLETRAFLGIELSDLVTYFLGEKPIPPLLLVPQHTRFPLSHFRHCPQSHLHLVTSPVPHHLLIIQHNITISKSDWTQQNSGGQRHRGKKMTEQV